MNSYRMIILSLGIIFTTYSCEKPPLEIETFPFEKGAILLSSFEDTCIIPPENHYPQYFVYDDNDWTLGGGISPNNQNRIVTFKVNRANSGINLDLWIVDLTNGEQTRLVEKGDMPAWGKNNWIAYYSYSDQQVWIIRPDGSESHRLTSPEDGAHYHPKWTRYGTLLVDRVSNSFNGPVLLNLDGELLDEFPQREDLWISNASLLSVSKENDLWLVATKTPNGSLSRLVMYNHKTKEQEIILEKSDQEVSSFAPITWLKEGETVIWSAQDGIYSMNLFTRSIRKVKSICTDFYTTISTTDDSKYILATRVDVTFLPGLKETRDSYITVIDPETAQEWKVNDM